MSADDVRRATGLLGLFFTIFFATSFTTALQRIYLLVWRRPRRVGTGTYWRGGTWLCAALGCAAALGALRGFLGGAIGLGLFAIVSLAATSGLWWFTAWFFLQGDVRARVLIPTGLTTSVAMTAFAVSATVWMPATVTSNEAQFGFFGVALSLVTWFAGAAICVLIGVCAGPVLAEDPGWVGTTHPRSRRDDIDPSRRRPITSALTRVPPSRRAPES